MNKEAVRGRRWFTDPGQGHLPVQFLDLQKEALAPSGLQPDEAPMREREGEEYGAVQFSLAGDKVAFRVAKTTPTKIGQFVTLWKRPHPGADIAPFDVSDPLTFVLVVVFDALNEGVFVFDRSVLGQKNILSVDQKGGKRAFRVYPPWVKPEAKQAIRTQKWQLEYFIPLGNEAVATQLFKRHFMSDL